ncbi:hypothetical protein Cgig2_019045 [Carnegiea gigantea]|uniref:FAR1 domain-containing protein n=1 Tax=Carnegiea gigantea TaxID=171969 RepID=A0A9Q1QGJ4_9CARY|nr:hypothetical protein Cgig2_019045 [Carnegiea gigantea]
METNKEEEQHQTTETFKSPTRIIKEWAPICEEELKPKEGLEFDNLDECERFYKNYTHGFSVRKSSCKKNKEGVEKYKYFVCSKEGFKRTLVKVNSNRKVKLTREGCDAMVDGTVLEGCSQMHQEDKLISDSWLEFMDCMEIAGRDPQKLMIALKGIQEISKELKDSSGNTSDGKVRQLESFIGSTAPEKIEILLPNNPAQKEVVSELREEKNRLLSNNKRERGFVNLVESKSTMIVPKEGLEFDNLDECERFYKNYAYHAGFSVRKSSCKKNKEGVEKYKYFVCSKEGFK